MTHPTPKTLDLFHDRQLRGSARDEVAAHVATCSTCRAELAGHAALTGELEALVDVPVPASLVPLVVARLREGGSGVGRHPSADRSVIRVAWSVLAMEVALVALLALYVAPSALAPAAARLATVPASSAAVAHELGEQLGGLAAPVGRPTMSAVSRLAVAPARLVERVRVGAADMWASASLRLATGSLAASSARLAQLLTVAGAVWLASHGLLLIDLRQQRDNGVMP